MSLSNIKVTSQTVTTRNVSWTIESAYGNAIIVKWRPTGSNTAWSSAKMAELSKTATVCVIADLNPVEYDVQVTQVDYGTSETVTGTKPVGAPPTPVTPPIIT